MEHAAPNLVIPAKDQSLDRAAPALDIVAQPMSTRKLKRAAKQGTGNASDLLVQDRSLRARTKNLSLYIIINMAAADQCPLMHTVPMAFPHHDRITASNRSMDHRTQRHPKSHNRTHRPIIRTAIQNTIPPTTNQFLTSHSPSQTTARVFMDYRTMESITSHPLHRGAKQAIAAKPILTQPTLSLAVCSDTQTMLLLPHPPWDTSIHWQPPHLTTQLLRFPQKHRAPQLLTV
jgi:hypothetical protein